MTDPIVRVRDDVYRIPTVGDFVNTFVFVDDDDSVTLVDTGYKTAPKRIVAGLAQIGRTPKDVQRIVLTHAHVDHVGGASNVLHQTGLTGVAVHEADAEYVESGRAPVNLESWSGRLMQRVNYGGFEPVAVAQQLHEGDTIEVGGGLTVHHTPGHTPGHISLRHEQTSTLITGDSIWNMASRMTWPIGAFCTSLPLNKQTAHVLGELQYDVVAFMHGPPIFDNAREAVRSFLRRKGVVAAAPGD